MLINILKDELQGAHIVTTAELPQAHKAGTPYQPIKEPDEFAPQGAGLKEFQQELLEVREKTRYLSYKNRYIVWLNEEGVNILDQHAGWEKVLYQRFSRALSDNRQEVQRLLLPEVVNLNPADAQLLKDNMGVFVRLGFELKEFGENSFIVHTRPVFLDRSPAEVIKSVLSETEDVSKEQKVLASLACHAAIKSGDRLSPEEAENLIKEVQDLSTPYCPHGRPALVIIKWQDLQRQFGRH